MSRWARKVPPPSSTGRMLLMQAAGLPLGVALEDLLRVSPEADVLPLPYPHPCLWGVMPTLEGACSILDIWPLAHGPDVPKPTLSGDRQVALFPHASGAVGLRLDHLAGLAPQVTPLPPEQQKAQLAALPAPVQPWLSGAARAGDHAFFFFSRDAFLAWVVAQQDMLTQA